MFSSLGVATVPSQNTLVIRHQTATSHVTTAVTQSQSSKSGNKCNVESVQTQTLSATWGGRPSPLPTATNPTWTCTVGGRKGPNCKSLHLHRAHLRQFGDRAFCVAAPHLWNDLPRNMRTYGSLYQFKRLLKTYLFKKAFYS